MVWRDYQANKKKELIAKYRNIYGNGQGREKRKGYTRKRKIKKEERKYVLILKLGYKRGENEEG